MCCHLVDLLINTLWLLLPSHAPFFLTSCFSFTKVTDKPRSRYPCFGSSCLIVHRSRTDMSTRGGCCLLLSSCTHNHNYGRTPTTSTRFDRSCGFPVSKCHRTRAAGTMALCVKCPYCSLERGEEGSSTLGLVSTRWQGFRRGRGGLCCFKADTATLSLFYRTVAQNVVTFAIQRLAGGVWQSRIQTMLVKNGQEHLWFCSQHSSTHLRLSSGAVSFISGTFTVSVIPA